MKANIEKLVSIGCIFLLAVTLTVCRNDVRVVPPQIQTEIMSVNGSQSTVEMADAGMAGAGNTRTGEAAGQAAAETLAAAEEDSKQTEEKKQNKLKREMQPKERSKDRLIGFIVDFDIDKISILMDNGEEMKLPVLDAEIDLRGGFSIGNVITVEYIKDLDDKEEDLQVIRIADSVDASRNEDEQDDQKEITGKLTAIQLGKIVIETEDKKEMVFKTIYTPVYFEKGIRKGNKVKISYVQESEKECQALSVHDGGLN